MSRKNILPRALGAALMLPLLLAGCRVENSKSGKDNDVKVSTPFGGVSVKTNEAAALNGVGLAGYPGATLDRKNDGDSNAADVNLSFGEFHMGVKAVSYLTPDDPQKVIAFYRKDLARYGQVVLCNGNRAVGQPTHTQDGLGCDDDSKGSVHNDDKGTAGVLKAGSRQRQHIVTVDHAGTGSKFGLVALDLPGHIKFSAGDDGKPN